jgi:hypothetical protein
MPVYKVAQPIQREWRLLIEGITPKLESRRKLNGPMPEGESVRLSSSTPAEDELYGVKLGFGLREDAVYIAGSNGITYDSREGRIVRGEAVNRDPETRNYLYWRASSERR